MKYDMTQPCDACPFLKKNKHGFTLKRLAEFASGQFPCHKTASNNEDDYEDGEGGYVANEDSQHCAGALIFCEKRNAPNQMMRICERLGMYDPRKLNMKAAVR